MNNKRYNKWHIAGNNEISFYLEGKDLLIEDIKIIFLKIIQQAERDLVSLISSTSAKEKILWEEAQAFLFNDEYVIDWGDVTLSFNDISYILGYDPNWMRKKIMNKIRKEIKIKYE